ncbi:hemerythrin domain-containing protein [Clostridium hydrogeniformans]|uniref:hemerythrin domain-containing protein n=1 Tax=Clostridium hydrogeniformans TaxID=349933 RepID=UPI0004862B52|nr:hemerythrin domain-containing protein [Clostridium hydrogeniformans]
MKSVEIMIDEHKNIKRMLKVIRENCLNILKGRDVDFEDFYKVIDFVRNYADKHHHNKEEEILFKYMGETLGDAIKNGPITGMLIEHDLGRLYIKNLEEALGRLKEEKEEAVLDIMTNSMAYAELLHRHIDKEDNLIYTFADARLSEDNKTIVDDKCMVVENEAKIKGIQENYINLLENLEKKVGILK